MDYDIAKAIDTLNSRVPDLDRVFVRDGEFLPRTPRRFCTRALAEHVARSQRFDACPRLPQLQTLPLRFPKTRQIPMARVIYVDSGYFIALLDSTDGAHVNAFRLHDTYYTDPNFQFVTTRDVLNEVLAHFSRSIPESKQGAASFAKDLFANPKYRIVVANDARISSSLKPLRKPPRQTLQHGRLPRYDPHARTKHPPCLCYRPPISNKKVSTT